MICIVIVLNVQQFQVIVKHFANVYNQPLCSKSFPTLYLFDGQILMSSLEPILLAIP
jgi:hypothetical protein